MKTVQLGTTEHQVPNVVLGLMRIAELDDEGPCAGRHRARRRHRLLRPCRRVRLDAARLRAPLRRGACSSRPAERAEITIQTKAGIVPDGPYFDFSYEHLIDLGGRVAARAADRLHRHPPAAPARCPGRARRGRARVRRARSGRQGPRVRRVEPDATADRPAEEVGDASRSWPTSCSCRSPTRRSSRRAWRRTWLGLDQSVTLDGGGIVDYCRLNDITIQAWSPFQAGFFTGVFLGSADYPELNPVIDRLAADYDVPPIAIATAWITRHPANMQVVLGTTTPERVRLPRTARTSPDPRGVVRAVPCGRAPRALTRVGKDRRA